MELNVTVSSPRTKRQITLTNGLVLYITLEGDKIVWVSESKDTYPQK